MLRNIPFRPRPFQERVLKCVLNGQSVILQAPTGSGKTRAALLPFIQNLAHRGDRLPLTCRYAVPLRVLANQFFNEYDTILQSLDRHAPTRLDEKYRKIGREIVAVQTGEQPGDAQFEAALTFCTIDQLLASFLAVPYSIGGGMANLNVAGAAGSYLVLDEFHLYPLLRGEKSVYGARTTTLQMLRLFAAVKTPFVLMTATFSKTLLDELGTLLGAEVITIKDEDELREIAEGRTRTFVRSSEPLDAQALLAQHQQIGNSGPASTLVVCNTVLRAQQLYLDLHQRAGEGTHVLLLHSRFSTADRRRLSDEIERELGPENWSNGVYAGRDIIVVATQVIEVGLNISAHALHTENAPANSIIQRAGRCARFARQHGTVTVYPLPLDEEGKAASTLPYDKALCEATWQVLERFAGRQVGFREEQEIIDFVHTQQDKELLQRYKQDEQIIVQKIFESWNTNDRSVSSALIRDVAQVQILIHDQPGEQIKETPWLWESFGMHPHSLGSAKRWAALQERGKDLEWVCQEALPVPEKELGSDGMDGVDQRRPVPYHWQLVTTPATFAKTLFVVFPSHLARYDDTLGFVLLDGQLDVEANGYQSKKLDKRRSGSEMMGSQRTSYQGHITGLVGAYNAGIAEDLHFLVRQVEQAMELKPGTVDQAIRLAIACHDLGKLDQQWQAWAFAWQTLVYKEQGRNYEFTLPYPAYCFAKTDNRYTAQYRQLQEKVTPKRPHHACESVAIGRKLLRDSLGVVEGAQRENEPVVRAVCGAIARHHTSQAHEYKPVTLSSHALEAAGEALRIAHQGQSWSYDAGLLRPQVAKGGDLAPETASSPLLTRPTLDDGQEGKLEALLYFLIVRALRLSDQRADTFASQ